MPTYAYACTQCDHRFDAVQSFSDAALTICPECQGALRKEYNTIGVTFKGSGFYRTDSRAAKEGGTEKKSESSEKKSESSEKKSESGGETGSSSTSSSSGPKTPAAPAAS